MDGLTHFDEHGNAVMVDISGKPVSARTARAGGRIRMNAQTLEVIRNGTAEKGDVLGVARIAGIMAAKKTARLIPLCHSLNFEHCAVDFNIPETNNSHAEIEAVCTVRISGKTGAEMEALTGASIALLTVYDMCKAIDRAMIINGVRLYEKTGGKSGNWEFTETPP